MTDVRVRFEAALLDHSWHDEAHLTRTPLVDTLVERGLLTVLEEVDGDADTDTTTPAGDAVPAGEAGASGTPAAVTGWFGPAPAEPQKG